MIQINKYWRIRIDKYNFILEHLKSTEKGNYFWDTVGYFGDLESMGKRLLSVWVLTKDYEEEHQGLEEFRQVLKELKEFKVELIKALKETEIDVQNYLKMKGKNKDEIK